MGESSLTTPPLPIQILLLPCSREMKSSENDSCAVDDVEEFGGGGAGGVDGDKDFEPCFSSHFRIIITTSTIAKRMIKAPAKSSISPMSLILLSRNIKKGFVVNNVKHGNFRSFRCTKLRCRKSA